MRYPYVLLDADETLFDFKRSEAEAFCAVMPAFGLFDPQAALPLYQVINDGYWKRLEQGETTRDRLLAGRFEDLFAALGIVGDAAGANAAYMARRAEAGGWLLPGALELCRRLHGRGHRLHIVTNAAARIQRSRFAASGLAPYFDGMFISEEIGTQKPDPAFFQAVFAALGHPPREQVIILGDSLTSDMRGGRLAGIATCWYNPHGGVPNADCDYTITRLDQFDAIALGAAAP